MLLNLTLYALTIELEYISFDFYIQKFLPFGLSIIYNEFIMYIELNRNLYDRFS